MHRATVIAVGLLAACCAAVTACAPAPGLTSGMQAVHDYQRFRTLLDTPVVASVAYFQPGSADWRLLVTEHDGATDLRGVLLARERFRDRWAYLEVGAPRGTDVDGVRALGWPVQLRSGGEAAPSTFVAVVPRGDRTLVLELRGGGALELATYRHPQQRGLPVFPVALACLIVLGAGWTSRMRRRALLT